MNDLFEKTREQCRKAAVTLIEERKQCHLDSTPHSDGCGYFRERFAYLRVDCRIANDRPLCWVSILDHYTGEVLYSEACPSTPEAAALGAEYFRK